MNYFIGDGLDVDVQFDFEPGQQEILYPTDSAQEGISEEVIITAVLANGQDITEDLNEDCLDRLQQEIFEGSRFN